MTGGAAVMALSLGLPLMLAAAIAIPGLRRPAMAASAWAAAPAFLLAVGPYGDVEIGWGGAIFGLRLVYADAVARAFLLLTSCVWLAAGVFARSYMAEAPRRARFWGMFLATLAGNLGVVLAGDVASFYAFYALMTFASYGLIVHEESEAANRAGRVYLVMALIGEMLLFTAFLLVVGTDVNIVLADVPRLVASSSWRDELVGLFLVGFGVKAGALLLHMWLPLAHPVAPTPASAVLSGALIKAGLLGWLRFLPLGLVAMPLQGSACVAAGVAAAFFGVALGITQKDPKTILAYSSVSQMGFMTATLGIGLSSPDAAGAAIAAILFYALHHALAKGALFLGTGVARATGSGWPRTLVALGLSLPALDLAGAPLSSGALAKISLKNMVALAPWGSTWLPAALALGAVASTLIMVRFFLRTIVPRGRGSPKAGLWIPWAALVLLDIGVLLRPPVATEELELLLDPGKVWSAAWPVLAGVAIAAAAWLVGRGREHAEVPPGDVLVPIELLASRLGRAVHLARRSWPVAPRPSISRPGTIASAKGKVLQIAGRVELELAGYEAIGLAFVILLLALLAAVLL